MYINVAEVSMTPQTCSTGDTVLLSVKVQTGIYARLASWTHTQLTRWTHSQLAHELLELESNNRHGALTAKLHSYLHTLTHKQIKDDDLDN